jgi:hypothetical protein
MFALERILSIKGKLGFYHLHINDKSQYKEFCDTIKGNSQYESELRTLLTYMELVSEIRRVPPKKYKPLKGYANAHEFRSKNLRVYVFHLEGTGKIVTCLGFKKNQTHDIKQFGLLKERILIEGFTII